MDWLVKQLMATCGELREKVGIFLVFYLLLTFVFLTPKYVVKYITKLNNITMLLSENMNVALWVKLSNTNFRCKTSKLLSQESFTGFNRMLHGEKISSSLTRKVLGRGLTKAVLEIASNFKYYKKNTYPLFLLGSIKHCHAKDLTFKL